MLATATAAHLQSFFAVEPAQLLVIHDKAFVLEQKI
jgi:hypothetical protein